MHAGHVLSGQGRLAYQLMAFFQGQRRGIRHPRVRPGAGHHLRGHQGTGVEHQPGSFNSFAALEGQQFRVARPGPHKENHACFRVFGLCVRVRHECSFSPSAGVRLAPCEGRV